MNRARRVLGLLAVASVLVCAGCGGEGAHDGTAGVAPPPTVTPTPSPVPTYARPFLGGTPILDGGGLRTTFHDRADAPAHGTAGSAH